MPAPNGRNPMKDRTFDRGRGCWNCKSFCNDQLARDHWKAAKARDAATFAMTGKGPLNERLGDMEASKPDPNRILRATTLYDTVEKAILAGTVGMCLVGGAPSEFVDHRFLCTKWTGRDGHSLATGGIARPVDLLPDELVERADERAKPGIGTKNEAARNDEPNKDAK